MGQSEQRLATVWAKESVTLALIVDPVEQVRRRHCGSVLRFRTVPIQTEHSIENEQSSIICDGACVFYCYDTSRIIMMEADIMQNGINPYRNSVIELAADKHGHALG